MHGPPSAYAPQPRPGSHAPPDAAYHISGGGPSCMERAGREWLAAGVSAGIADTLGHPFEVLKVRAQISQVPATSLELLRGIVAREGWHAVVAPGLFASWLCSITYAGARLGMFPVLRDTISERGLSSLASSAMAGAITGGIACTLFHPLDLARTRLQAQSWSWRGPSVAGVLAQAVTQGTLWRGVSMSFPRAVVLSSVQLTTYEAAKTCSLGRTRQPPTAVVSARENHLSHAVCALFAGCLSQFLVMPIDAVRTQMMTRREATASRRSAVAVARDMCTDAGVASLWRGAPPAILRQGALLVPQFVLWERLRMVLLPATKQTLA